MGSEFAMSNLMSVRDETPMSVQVEMLKRHGLKIVGEGDYTFSLQEIINLNMFTIGSDFDGFLAQLAQRVEQLEEFGSSNQDRSSSLSISYHLKNRQSEIMDLIKNKTTRDHPLILSLISQMFPIYIKVFHATHAKISSQDFGFKSDNVLRLLRTNDMYLEIQKCDAHELETLSQQTSKIIFRVKENSLAKILRLSCIGNAGKGTSNRNFQNLERGAESTSNNPFRESESFRSDMMSEGSIFRPNMPNSSSELVHAQSMTIKKTPINSSCLANFKFGIKKSEIAKITEVFDPVQQKNSLDANDQAFQNKL
jgi:hypothetical protein